MKYIFYFIWLLIRHIVPVVLWFLFNFFLIVWHWDLLHLISYKDFAGYLPKGAEIFSLRWTVIYLTLTVVAAIFGFGWLLPDPLLAQGFFWLFLILFVLSLLFGNDLLER